MILERHIEKVVSAYAMKLGWLTYKFVSPSNRGVCDRIFIRPNGEVVFCEFKREGKKPTKLQAHHHKQLREQNCTVWVIDSVELGKEMINEPK